MQSLYLFTRNCYLELFAALGWRIDEQAGWQIVRSEIIHSLLNGACYMAGQSHCPLKFLTIADSLCDPCSLWVEESRDTAPVAKLLVQEGLKQCASVPGMALRLTNSSIAMRSSGCISLIQSKEEFLEWVDVLATNFNCSSSIATEVAKRYCQIGFSGPFYHAAAKKNGRIVATGTLLSLEDGAYLYNVSTLAEERKKGLASDVSATLLRLARFNNCQRVALLCPSITQSIYQKMGFETVLRFALFQKKRAKA